MKEITIEKVKINKLVKLKKNEKKKAKLIQINKKNNNRKLVNNIILIYDKEKKLKIMREHLKKINHNFTKKGLIDYNFK